MRNTRRFCNRRAVFGLACSALFAGGIAAAEPAQLKVAQKNNLHQPETRNEMVYVNLEQATLDEANAVLSVQGIVNRTTPRIFVFQGKANRWGRFVGQESHNKNYLPAEFTAKYRTTDDLFEEYYVQKRGFKKREITSLDEFFEEFRPYLKGAVRYDLAKVDHRVVAFSFASAEDYLPVTDALLKSHPVLATLPVKESLPGRFHDELESQRWAYERIGSKCAKSAVASYWPNETWLSIDHGIARRAYFYCLNYRPSENRQEYELLQRILAGLKPGAAVLGWGNGEDAILGAIARYKIYLLCDSVPNLSFHRAVKPVSSMMPDKPRRFVPEEVRLENKYYVAFMINEGDTLKCMGTFYNGGQWFWPQRGQIPINWGSNPALVEAYPALMEAIYSSMSAQDLFFSSITGYGYYNPKYSPGADLFPRKERRANPLGHMTVGSIYSVHNMMEATSGWLDPKTDKWLVARGCEGYVFEAAQAAYLKFTSAMQPLIGVDWSLFYWRYRFDKGVVPLQGAIQRIKTLAETHQAPFLIPVYAGSPGEFKQMADALPADRFKVVLLDEMVELAKRIGQSQLSHERVLMQGDTSCEVELTLRNWQKPKRSGEVAVEKPEGWTIKPDHWNYAGLGERQSRVQKFQILVPASFIGTNEVILRDSGTGREMKLAVSRQAEVSAPSKPPLARTIFAARGTPKVDGDPGDWACLPATVVEHDLGKLGHGVLAARYRTAWDDRNLYFLIEETTPPKKPTESYSEVEFGGGEFKTVNGVSFWIDFTGKGTTENGEFAPRFGFSSTGRSDFYTCTLNNRVLVSSRPRALIATSGQAGHRVIEASIAWSEIDALLERENLPYGGIRKAVRPGFGFGLQPLLIEDKQCQAFLNGFSPGRGGNTSVLEKKQSTAGPPSGADPTSLWVELR